MAHNPDIISQRMAHNPGINHPEKYTQWDTPPGEVHPVGYTTRVCTSGHIPPGYVHPAIYHPGMVGVQYHLGMVGVQYPPGYDGRRRIYHLGMMGGGVYTTRVCDRCAYCTPWVCDRCAYCTPWVYPGMLVVYTLVYTRVC